MADELMTLDEAQRVQRVLGYCDGWADLWAANEGIGSQIERMFSSPMNPAFVDLILKWSKQAYGEGCYYGFKEAQAIAKAEIEPLRAQLALKDKALAVFAKVAITIPHSWSDDCRLEIVDAVTDAYDFTAGDLRALLPQALSPSLTDAKTDAPR